MFDSFAVRDWPTSKHPQEEREANLTGAAPLPTRGHTVAVADLQPKMESEMSLYDRCVPPGSDLKPRLRGLLHAAAFVASVPLGIALILQAETARGRLSGLTAIAIGCWIRAKP